MSDCGVVVVRLDVVLLVVVEPSSVEGSVGYASDDEVSDSTVVVVVRPLIVVVLPRFVVASLSPDSASKSDSS